MADDFKKAIIKAFESIKREKPLIHHITNYVVMNLTANATICVGASPVMAHAIEEIEEMATISKALVLNVGTLSDKWVESMFLAGKRANEKKIPIVFDPVGMGATEFRTNVIQKLVNSLHPSIIKGNSSEIGLLNGDQGAKTCGVDAAQPADNAQQSVRDLAKNLSHSTVVASSGKIDYISDGIRVVAVNNGSERLSLLTGMGCTVSALMACFAAVTENYLVAAAGGLAMMGVCAEIADEQTQGKGPATFQIALFDQLALLNSAEFERRMRINIIE